MIYVRLHNELVELPSAQTLLEVDGHVSLLDEAGVVVARFDKFDVIAYSADREKLDMEEAAPVLQLNAVDGRGNGHAG